MMKDKISLPFSQNGPIYPILQMQIPFEGVPPFWQTFWSHNSPEEIKEFDADIAMLVSKF